MVEVLAVPEALQKHWAFHGARMERRETYRGHVFFVGEGGPHFDARGIVEKEDGWMTDGYYLSAWGLLRGKAVLGSPMYFKLNHNLELNEDQRKKARLDSATAVAKESIDTMFQGGLLE